MTPLPRLTSETGFVIEQVARKPDTSGDFVVTLRLTDGERRSLCVSHDMLFDFGAFRAAALFGANVLLRHEAEEQTLEGRLAWLNIVSEAIIRGNERPVAPKGVE